MVLLFRKLIPGQQIYIRIAKQMDRDNEDVMGEPVKMIQANCH